MTASATTWNFSLPDTRSAELFDRIPRPQLSLGLARFALKIALSLGTLTALNLGYGLAIKGATTGSVASIGCFSVVIIVDYLMLLVAAFLNRRDVNRIVEAHRRAANADAGQATEKQTNQADDKDTGRAAEKELNHAGNADALLCPDGSVSVAVVGYREDEKAWRECLRSLQKQTLKPRAIIAVVDGNEAADQVMADAFLEVFQHYRARVIHLPQLLAANHRAAYQAALAVAQEEHGDHAKTASKGSDSQGSSPRWSVVKRWTTIQRWLNGAYTPEEYAAHKAAWNYVVGQITEWKQSLDISDDLDAVCFTQPHGHKRTAMFTGLAMGMYALTTRDALFVTDSDTLVQPNALDELLCILRSNDGIGAVTGEIRIWNASSSWLTRICMARYWMSSNIERGCESFWRCVSCLPGPMALYRACDLNDVLGRWSLQTWGGAQATFGDDRHMTSQILSLGRHTRYTHRTWCDSESPETFIRWIRQQTRWVKSFYREIFWFPVNFVSQSWWLLFEAAKRVFFTCVLLATLLHLFYISTDPRRPLVWAGTVGLVTVVKAMVAVPVTGDLWMFAFIGFGFVYFFGLLPTNVWALFTSTKNTWGTSARTQSERKKTETFRERSFHVAYLCVWYVIVAVGISHYLSGITHSRLCYLITLAAIPPTVAAYIDKWPWQRSPPPAQTSAATTHE